MKDKSEIIDHNDKEKFPEGHFVRKWMGIGIAIFTVLGIPISFIMELPEIIAIWPAVGVAVGLPIGTSIESKYKEEGRIIPKTVEGNKRLKLLLFSGIVLGMILLALLLFLYFKK